MAFKEKKKEPVTVREKIAESFVDAFGIGETLANMLVTNKEFARVSLVDLDMEWSQSEPRVMSCVTDLSALEEFFLDVQARTGFQIPSIVIERQFDLFDGGRLRVSDLIKTVEDAVALGLHFKTYKEIQEEAA